MYNVFQRKAIHYRKKTICRIHNLQLQIKTHNSTYVTTIVRLLIQSLDKYTYTVHRKNIFHMSTYIFSYCLYYLRICNFEHILLVSSRYSFARCKTNTDVTCQVRNPTLWKLFGLVCTQVKIRESKTYITWSDCIQDTAGSAGYMQYLLWICYKTMYYVIYQHMYMQGRVGLSGSWTKWSILNIYIIASPIL